MRARHRHLNARDLGARLVLDSRYIDQSDNTAVSTWSDRSGTASDATQTNATFQPTFQTAEFGGNGVVRFDGSNDFFSVAGAVGLLRNISGATLTVMVKYSSVSGTRSAFAFATGTGLTRATMEATSSGYIAGGRRLDANSFQSVTSSASTAGRTLIQTAVFNYGAATLELFLDGTSAASSTSFQTTGNTSDTDSTAVRVASSVVGTNFFEGDVAFVAATPLAMTASQRRRLEHASAYSFKLACN
jgi:hypothetical protein